MGLPRPRLPPWYRPLARRHGLHPQRQTGDHCRALYSVGLDLDDDGGLRKYDMKDHMDKLNQNSLLRDKIPAPIDGDWILYPR